MYDVNQVVQIAYVGAYPGSQLHNFFADSYISSVYKLNITWNSMSMNGDCNNEQELLERVHNVVQVKRNNVAIFRNLYQPFHFCPYIQISK